MVKVSIFSIVVAILLINIVLHHLFNWWARGIFKRENDGEFLGMLIIIVITLSMSLVIMDEVTS